MRGLHPWISGVVVLGVALSIAQQWTIPDEVYFSGDGGIKSLLTKQFARGDWHADLRLEAEPWADALWRDGLYPFGQPFAFQQGDRWYVSFAAPFMAITAPFYRVLGFRGLTLVPLLGLWLSWLATAVVLRRLELTPAAQTIGLGGLIFASFLTPYGAMYWEHTLAVGIACAGWCLVFPAGPTSRGVARPFAGGLLLGAAIWARPESVAFAAGVCAALVWLRCRAPEVLALAGGIAIAGGAFALTNLALYGNVLGVVALRKMEAQHIGYAPGQVVLWEYLMRTLWLCPVLAFAAGVSLAGLRVPALRSGRLAGALWIPIATTFVGAAFLSRHSGGDQIGARYVLHTLPLLFALVALQWSAFGALPIPMRRGLRIAVLVLLAAGIYGNTVEGTQTLLQRYHEEFLPVLDDLRADPNTVVAVEHQWMAQAMAAEFETKTFFRIRTAEHLGALSRALLAQGIARFTLISYRDEPARRFNGEGFALTVQPRRHLGSLFLVDGTLAPRP